MNAASITIPVKLGAIYSLGFRIRLKSPNTGSYRKFLACTGPSTDRSPGMWFRPNDNRLHIRQSINGANDGADTITSLTVGEWYDIVFTCEALSNNTTRLQSWVNGVLETTSVNPGYPDYNDSPLELLSNDYDIEDIRVYNHVLSKREVVDLNKRLLSRYRLTDNGHDVEDVGTMSYGSGEFLDTDKGKALVLGTASANIPLSAAPLSLKGETITFWQRCGTPRASVGGGGFTNWIIQWGDYYGSNSGGFGLQSGGVRYYLRGPGAGGWTDTGSVSSANALYDEGGWIFYAIVFTDDDRLKIYMNGTLYVDRGLSVPYTGLSSGGITFGRNMLADLLDVRIHRCELTANEIRDVHQQRMSVDSNGSVHVSTVIQGLKARYIRDWLNGSTSNSGDHWLEVRALRHGTNISLGKPVTASDSGGRLDKVTDGNTSNGGYAYVNASGPCWVQVDLGSIQEINEVQVWHYNADGRTYYDTKTEVSEDGVTWIPIFDSEFDGLYPETPAGVTYKAVPRAPKITPRGVYLSDVSEVGPTENLLAWYPLNGTAEQRAFYSDLYNVNAVIDGNGVLLNGVNSFFSLAGIVSSGATNRFTVTMLIKPTSAGIVLCPSSQGVDQFLRYDSGNERIYVQIAESGDTNGRSYSSSNGSVPLNQWSFVAFTIDGTDVSLYVGESYVAGIVGTGPIGSWHGRWDVGRRANGTYYFGGRVKDLRVYDEPLPTNQIVRLASLTNTRKTKLLQGNGGLYAKRHINEVAV
jgi:hypothetical protein